MRRRKLPGALTVGLVLAVAIFVLWPQPIRVTRVNLERIQGG
jgi:hypothetical protein